MNGCFVPGELTETGGFLAAVYCGLVMGILYELFGLLRRPFKGPFMLCILDLLYYAAAAALAALSLLYINCGRPRLYLIGGMTIGIYLYARFPGRLIRAGRAKRAKLTKKQLR